MDIVNFPNGFRPQGSDFLKRQENVAADFARLRVSAGRGVAQGLTLTRQADGAVVLSGGHGNDALGNAIVVRLAETLDLSSAGLPIRGQVSLDRRGAALRAAGTRSGHRSWRRLGGAPGQLQGRVHTGRRSEQGEAQAFSIHAPVVGATSARFLLYPANKFQFTRP